MTLPALYIGVASTSDSSARSCRCGPAEPANASAVIASIEQAVADVAGGHASAVVTNPIAKSVLYSVGFAHSGHTEFLAALAQRHQPGTDWFAGHDARQRRAARRAVDGAHAAFRRAARADARAHV